MDLYRYFHPHHNPRLRNIPLRLQELCELQQAALELSKAVRRAEVRTDQCPCGQIRKEHLAEIRSALEYAVDALTTLTEAHPGDGQNVLEEMAKEREEAPGWENWTRLLSQRLHTMSQYESVPEDS